MQTLFYILGATFLVSLISFVGVLTLSLKQKILSKILLALVGLSAGAMMGGAFLHLLPESIEALDGSLIPYILVIVGFVIFFLVEKILHWRHCHKSHCDIHTFGYMNVIGDGIHNFIDGLIIAATFMVNIELGVVSLLAIILHEIPQEISDFGVLLYAGFSKLKALMFNFLSAIAAMLGGLAGYFLVGSDSFVYYLLPIAAGGFIYIAAADLLPELKKEEKWSKFIPSFIIFLFGIGLMIFLRSLD